MRTKQSTFRTQYKTASQRIVVHDVVSMVPALCSVSTTLTENRTMPSPGKRQPRKAAQLRPPPCERACRRHQARHHRRRPAHLPRSRQRRHEPPPAARHPFGRSRFLRAVSSEPHHRAQGAATAGARPHHRAAAQSRRGDRLAHAAAGARHLRRPPRHRKGDRAAGDTPRHAGLAQADPRRACMRRTRRAAPATAPAGYAWAASSTCCWRN